MFLRKLSLIWLAVVLLAASFAVPFEANRNKAEAAAGNIALNKPISASSEVNSGHPAKAANDGNPEWFWESVYTLPQTLTVDLGSAAAVNKLIMKIPSAWTARTTTLSIQGSLDNVQFTDIVPSATYSFSPASGNSVTVTLPTADARYVRLSFTGSSVRTSAALSELEIYTDPNAPDLIVTDIAWLPANPKAGDAVTFSATVKNIGGTATPAGTGHKAAFKLDGQTVALTDPYSLSIPVGGTAVLTASTTWTAEKFKFDVQAVPNAEGTIGESNADNNGDYSEPLEVGGTGWQAYFNLKEQLGIYPFPEEQVSCELDFTGYQVQKEHIRLLQRGVQDPIVYQLSNVVENNGYLLSATINFRTSLALGEVKRFVADTDPAYTPSFPPTLGLTDNGDGTATLAGNQQWIKVPYGVRNYNQAPMGSVPAPLLAIARQPGQWIGSGSFTAPASVTVSQVNGRVVEQGPLFVKYKVTYTVSGNRTYECEMTVFLNEKHVTVDETYSGFKSSDNVNLKFSYLNGVDPDGRIVMQNGGYSLYSPSNPGGFSGKYADKIDNQGKLPYELGMYSVNSGGIMHSTSFWKDGGDNAILFAVNRVRDWKTEIRKSYQSLVEQNLKFYSTAVDKYMTARIEGTERHWAVSVIPRSDMVMSGRRGKDWTVPPPVTVDSTWTQVPAVTTMQPGNTPDVKLWEKLADLSLNRYKDMIFDFPEDVSIKLPIPYMTNMPLDSPNDLWDGIYHKFTFYYIITDKFWDVSGELGGAAWAGRGQRLNFSDYAYNRDKSTWTLSQRKRARSLLVFHVYTAEDDNNLPHTSMLGGHPNFNMDIKQVLGMAAGIFPQHPHAARWKAEFMKDYNEVMNVWARDANPALHSEGGRWYENLPTYTNASFLGMLAARAGILQYDGTDLFQNETFKEVIRWVMNSLTAIERGTFRAAIPIGAHSAGGQPGGEFDGLYKILAEQLIQSDPALGNQMLWMATNGTQGTKPALESALYTDYGPVLRYDFGGPNEAFVYLQQLNSQGYRWNPYTNGTVYYTADGKRWSWNATEDSGDAIDYGKLPIMHLNGKGLGEHRSDGVLYNFGNVQYYKALANKDFAPYLSRSVMMVQDRYIGLYDDMANTAADGTFVWANRESGLKEELFDNADFTNPVAVKIDNQRFPGSGIWNQTVPDPAMGPDTWSIRWTGEVMPAYTQAYTFYAETAPGDSAKIWVNGQLVTDTLAGVSNPVNLTAKQLYDIKLEYVHQTGTASVVLKWSSASQAKGQIPLNYIYRELDQQPSIYTVKDGPGDEFHIVAPNPLTVAAQTYGAVVNGSEYVFQSDTDQTVQDEVVSFNGKVGYAQSNELALFDGTKIGYDGFVLERMGGEFGVSAKRINHTSITGRFAGLSGGTVTVTPPSGFSFDNSEVKVNGVAVPATVTNGSISFDAAVAQSDGYKTFTITSAPASLFYDDFEDGDSAGWSTVSGTWSTAADGAGTVYRQSGGSGGSTTAGDAAWTDYAVQARAKFTASAPATADLLGRYTDGNNFYYLQLNGSENKLKLYKKASGAVSLLQSVPFTVHAGQTYNLKLAFSGPSVQGYVDGVQLVGAADTSLGSGKIGLRTSSGADFDDVSVIQWSDPDITPPTTAALLNGTERNGWYVTGVQVELTATDDKAGVADTSYSPDGGATWKAYDGPLAFEEDGIHTLLFRSTDTKGNMEREQSVVFRTDRTQPFVLISGGGTYSIGQTVTVTCTATDTVSSVVYSSCPGPLLNGPAYRLNIGVNTVTAEALDAAGNMGTAADAVTVQVTLDGLIGLIKDWIGSSGNAGIVQSLETKLRHGQFEAFLNEVHALKDKQISGEAADYLVKFTSELTKAPYEPM